MTINHNHSSSFQQSIDLLTFYWPYLYICWLWTDIYIYIYNEWFIDYWLLSQPPPAWISSIRTAKTKTTPNPKPHFTETAYRAKNIFPPHAWFQTQHMSIFRGFSGFLFKGTQIWSSHHPKHHGSVAAGRIPKSTTTSRCRPSLLHSTTVLWKNCWQRWRWLGGSSMNTAKSR